jgi:hypothetical protein
MTSMLAALHSTAAAIMVLPSSVAAQSTPEMVVTGPPSGFSRTRGAYLCWSAIAAFGVRFQEWRIMEAISFQQ